MLESLESRRLMTTTLENGVLTIRGSEVDDSVNVWQPVPEMMRVNHNGTITDFAADGVKLIFVSVGDGNDVVVLGRRGPNAKICGGAGNDSLSAGDGNDTIYGDGGDDYLYGRDGHDHLDGGDGTGRDSDDMFGGNGLDTVDYSARVHHVRVGLGVAFNDGEAGEFDNARTDIEIANGGAGDDLLKIYGPVCVTLHGHGGNDTLIGGTADDLLDGGDGEDELHGEAGFDSYLAKDGQPDVILVGSDFSNFDKDAFDVVQAAA